MTIGRLARAALLAPALCASLPIAPALAQRRVVPVVRDDALMRQYRPELYQNGRLRVPRPTPGATVSNSAVVRQPQRAAPLVRGGAAVFNR